MGEWKPIETAPKDGTPVDLWCVDPTGEFVPEDGGVRLTDCWWGSASEIFPHTGWRRTTDDGHWDAVEEPPCCPLGLPSWKPTHWKPSDSPRIPSPREAAIKEMAEALEMAQWAFNTIIHDAQGSSVAGETEQGVECIYSTASAAIQHVSAALSTYRKAEEGE